MLDLMEIWKEVEQVIVVDAVLSGSPPGKLHIWDARVEKMQNTIFRSSTHAFTLADAVELGRILDRLPKTLTVYGIEAAQFDTGNQLSHEASGSIEHTARMIASRLDAPAATELK
jgi:hydrogenase maturation protease